MRTRISLILLLLMSLPAAGGALVKYVDTGATGSGSGEDWANAYTSLATAEALNWNLTDAGGDTLTIWVRASTGVAETATITFDGWTLSSTCYLTVKDYDDTYITRGSGNWNLLIQDQYVRFEGLHVETAGDVQQGIYVGSIASGGSDIRITGCEITGSYSGANSVGYGINVADVDATVMITACRIGGYVNGVNNTFAGMLLRGSCSVANAVVTNCRYGMRRTSETHDIYNSTVYGCTLYGMDIADCDVINCIVANNADDFDGEISATIDYCASDDGDGTHAIAPAGGDWANEFVDAAGGDFDLLATGNCFDAGTTDPGGANQPDTDIEGVARTAPWSVGAYEEDAPAQAGGPQAELILITEE